MKPECEMGWTDQQLRIKLGLQYNKFQQWMTGQTQALCEGRQWNHDTGQYEEACGGVAHGPVTYPWDLDRFMAGLPVFD